MSLSELVDNMGSVVDLADTLDQGYILEASPLPKLPVAGLQPLQEPDTVFQVSLDHQSKEEEAVNGKDSSIKYQGTFPRYPFILLVDGIVSVPHFSAFRVSAPNL